MSLLTLLATNMIFIQLNFFVFYFHLDLLPIDSFCKNRKKSQNIKKKQNQNNVKNRHRLHSLLVIKDCPRKQHLFVSNKDHHQHRLNYFEIKLYVFSFHSEFSFFHQNILNVSCNQMLVNKLVELHQKNITTIRSSSSSLSKSTMMMIIIIIEKNDGHRAREN